MSDTAPFFLVQQVDNFGGFFAGEIVTVTAIRRHSPSQGAGGNSTDGEPSEEPRTLAIDERVFTNVRDRHTIAAGMLLKLALSGERVDRAELIGATSQAELRAALGTAPPAAPLDGPLVLSYRCDPCGLWLAGAPEDDRCWLCGHPIDPRSHAKAREEEQEGQEK
jgi:hypothetical protein